VKKFEDMYNRLDSIPACDGQTDILRRHSICIYSPRYAYASRGNDYDDDDGDDDEDNYYK